MEIINHSVHCDCYKCREAKSYERPVYEEEYPNDWIIHPYDWDDYDRRNAYVPPNFIQKVIQWWCDLR